MRLKSVLIGLLASAAVTTAAAESLKYEPSVTRLIGKLESNAGATPDGNPVSYPALKLATPVRVLADKTNELNRTEEQVSIIQLVLSPSLIERYKAMRGQTAAVTGTLMHSHTGHHYTAVLMTVQRLEPVTRPLP